MRHSHLSQQNVDSTHAGTQIDPDWNTARPLLKRAFCIFINTLGEGMVAAVRGNEGKPCVFTTRAEAEREIADNMMTRLQEFMDGERDFDDAMTVEEYVMEVDQMPDGSIVTEDGSTFR